MIKDYRITRSLIQGLDEDKALWVIRGPAFKEWVAFDEAALTNMTPGQKAFVAIEAFGYEIFTGGIDLFFSNSGGSLAHEALEGFRLVGAEAHAGLIEKVYQLFPNSRVPKSREIREDTISIISDELRETIFKEFDDKFYDLVARDSPNKYLVSYLAKHPEEFFVDP